MSLKAAWQAQQTAAGGFSPYGGLNEFTVSLLVVIGAAQAVADQLNDTALVSAAKDATGNGAYKFTFISQTPPKLRGVSAVLYSATLASYSFNVIDTDMNPGQGIGGTYITIQFIDKADTALALPQGTVVVANFTFGD